MVTTHPPILIDNSVNEIRIVTNRESPCSSEGGSPSLSISTRTSTASNIDEDDELDESSAIAKNTRIGLYNILVLES